MSQTGMKSIQVFYPLESETDSVKKERVYHYTSPQGLYAILDKGTIRFTDCQFLNDKSEFIHILTPLKKAVLTMSDCFREQIGNRLLEIMETDYQTDDYSIDEITSKNIKLHFGKKRYYVFCASTAKDDLNMWNYYTKNGVYQGYNIGFSSADIINCFSDIINERVSVLYGKVLYTEKDQVNFLQEKLRDYEDILSESDVSYEAYQENIDTTIGGIREIINNYRLFFKDDAFKNEKEYRIVISMPVDLVMENGSIKMGFDMKNGIVTPHCDVLFKGKSNITSITLSPMMEPEIAEQGLRRLLIHHGYKEKIRIDQSKIPIRY